MTTVFRRIMKIQDYKVMLHAVEQALEVCDRSSGFMDHIQGEICSELRDTRDRLLGLIEAAEVRTT